ncbi:MAG: nicotinate-nucleotide adenylyltransferase [Parvibaculum sp.]|nr:nicotinate-nucleotide adenylyltransferase [Parvibaculum sp.]|tara:strand:+ start:15602 stop:16198 length:597 start_codon:yes stop_codon:yes gene_type:complete
MRPVPPPGATIGLMGGSFNPAHEGHLHVARLSARALGLDAVWLLVSPQNPLKPASGMAPQAKRLVAARALVKSSRARNIIVTGIEAELRTTRTVDTLRALKRRYPLVHFVWLMGADNMLQFPRWAKWREITRTVPIAVYPRPGFTLRARLSPAAVHLRAVTLEASDAKLLSQLAAPALVFLEGRTHNASATAIRAAAS